MKKIILFVTCFLFTSIASCNDESNLFSEEGKEVSNEVEGFDSSDESILDEDKKASEKEEPQQAQDSQPSIGPILETYKVVWHNGSEIIEIDENVVKGSTPEYNGKAPIKRSNEYEYSFIGWNTFPDATTIISPLPRVESDLDFYAVFTLVGEIKYTVKFFNEEKEIIDASKKVKSGIYNISDLYTLEIPTKASDVQYDYIFSGWAIGNSSSIITSIEVNHDISLYAKYSSKLREYTIIWKNYDESFLSSTEHEYGSIPSYIGPTPTRNSEGMYSYIFKGWSVDVGGSILSSLPKVTGIATYFAVYEAKIVVTKETLKEVKTFVTSRGDGYTYLDYDLNIKYKSWNELVTEGYITITSSPIYSKYIDSVNLDSLGKGVLEFPSDQELVYSSSNSRNIFEECELIDGVNIPPVIWQSQLKAFARGCSSIRIVEFLAPKEGTNSNLASVGSYAFYGCKLLEIVNFNNPNITTIDSSAFKNCSSLKTVNLPSKLNSIAFDVFANTSSLEEINLPSTLTTINSEAFWESGIKRLIVNSTITCGTSTFESSGLTAVIFNGENAKMIFDGHATFKSCKNLSIFDFSKIEWKEYHTHYFSNTGFTSIDFTNTDLTFIPGHAFYGCVNLTSITFSSSISSIGQYAFSDCYELTTVINLTSDMALGAGCFQGCSKLKLNMSFKHK